VLTGKQRRDLVAQITGELNDNASPKGPVIFEIPLEQTGKIDVLVVWEAWKDIPSEIRSSIILDAYKKKADEISQPLGVTYPEAIEQHLLPYAIKPMARQNEAKPEELKAVMLEHGGIPLEGDRVDLRLPTLAMAEEIHRKLCDKLPKCYWSIVQSPSPIF
jgi:hypothetical protein